MSADGRSGYEVDLLVAHVELHDWDGQTSHLGEGLEGRKMATMGPIVQVLRVLLRSDGVFLQGAAPHRPRGS